jgi:enoyl-CoA hydratase/carnithine racemase
MSAYEDLIYEAKDGVAVISLNRPQALNAYTAAMGASLKQAVADAVDDDAVRVIVLTGAGRGFCAGADMNLLQSIPANGRVTQVPDVKHDFYSGLGPDVGPHYGGRFGYLLQVRKPVIAAINGHAVGLGMTIPLQCDIRIIAKTAKCGIVQNRRGVMPDAHSHWTLPRIVGHARAAEILLTGKMFTGVDAAAWGLASEALDAAEVLPRALEIAHEIATHVAPVSVAVSKRLLWADPPPTQAKMHQLETDLHLVLMGQPDSREGVLAFLDKRDPQWTMTLEDHWPAWLDDEPIVGPMGES